MASGRLGALSLAAATDTLLYTVPDKKVATVTVSICNTGPQAIAVRLAAGTAAAPTATDYLIYDLVVPAGGFAERTGIVLAATEKLFVRANLGTASIRAHGFEEDA